MEERKRPLVFGKLSDIIEAKRAEAEATYLARKALLERDEHCQDCDGICWSCEARRDCYSPVKDEIERVNNEYDKKNSEYINLLQESYFIERSRRTLIEEADKLKLQIKNTRDAIKALDFTIGVLESQLAAKEKELKDFESSH